MENQQFKLSASAFIHEKSGNIKDFYKITSCIGRGMPYRVNHSKLQVLMEKLENVSTRRLNRYVQ